MNLSYFRPILITVLLAGFVPISLSAVNSNPRSREFAADAGWKFFLGDPSGAENPSFADVSWRSVDLPHDWSIESKPDKDNPSGSGGGLFPRRYWLVSQNIPCTHRLEKESRQH